MMRHRWLLVLLLMLLPTAAAAQIYFMQGEQGEQGLPGLQGDKGDKGPPGETGPKGLSGDTGLQGLKGDTGAPVTGQSENPGANCAAGGVKYTINANSVYVCNGVKGPTGDQGIKGIKGDTGDKGDTGPKGLSGDTGIAGVKGDPGQIGDSVFSCSGGKCTALASIAVSGLTVTSSYSLPPCPDGYTKDPRADIVLCSKGEDDIVRVGDFWIDRYEAVIADETYWAAGGCGGPGNTYGNGPAYPGSFPFTGNWTAKLYACSKSGIKPSMGMTWFQAQEACAASGKRLCANEEWQAAAAGTFDQGSNNGSVNTRCNTQAGNKERNTGLAGDKPGDGDCCVSRWGAEDMIGNLWEWVAMWGQAGPDSGVANGQYIGRVDGTPAVEIGGFAGFSPETTGQGDGTWNVAGTATGCDRNGSACARKIGLPFAGVRGGDWGNGTKGGAFAISFDNGPSYNGSTVGFRCCRGF